MNSLAARNESSQVRRRANPGTVPDAIPVRIVSSVIAHRFLDSSAEWTAWIPNEKWRMERYAPPEVTGRAETARRTQRAGC